MEYFISFWPPQEFSLASGLNLNGTIREKFSILGMNSCETSWRDIWRWLIQRRPFSFKWGLLWSGYPNLAPVEYPGEPLNADTHTHWSLQPWAQSCFALAVIWLNINPGTITLNERYTIPSLVWSPFLMLPLPASPALSKNWWDLFIYALPPWSQSFITFTPTPKFSLHVCDFSSRFTFPTVSKWAFPKTAFRFCLLSSDCTFLVNVFTQMTDEISLKPSRD